MIATFWIHCLCMGYLFASFYEIDVGTSGYRSTQTLRYTKTLGSSRMPVKVRPRHKNNVIT